MADFTLGSGSKKLGNLHTYAFNQIHHWTQNRMKTQKRWVRYTMPFVFLSGTTQIWQESEAT